MPVSLVKEPKECQEEEELGDRRGTVSFAEASEGHAPADSLISDF